MTKAEILSKLKKPLITLIISVIVLVISLFSIKTITVNAQANTNTATAVTQQDNNKLLDGLLNVNDNNGTLELVLLITILSIAPSLLILMTSFTRIIIVFSLLRNAMGIQQTPPNQVLVGLALFLTFFIMAPVFKEIDKEAYQGYKSGEYSTLEAAKKATVPLKEWMLKQTSKSSMDFFLELADEEMPEENVAENLGLQVVVPAFIVSELKRAFIIGFLLYIPFLVIDIIVASVLMSMGMIMLPPAMISMPFKILLFIMINGWELLIGTLVSGFN
jgi:flagellar biosynthetic protein FliP